MTEKPTEKASASVSQQHTMTLQELKDFAEEKARQAWEDYLNKEKPHLNQLKGDGKPSNDSCHCSYIVDDVTLSYPDGYPNVDLGFGTPTNSCDPGGNPFETCDYVQALYNSFFYTQPSCVTLFNEDCADVWSTLPPTFITPHSFNCTVPAHSDFQITFSAIALSAENCSSWHLFNSGRLTFRILCQDNTNECGGYGYATDPITLHISGWNFSANQAISLTGSCGCIPVPN